MKKKMRLQNGMTYDEFTNANARFFINRMIMACEEIKENLRMDIPLTIGGITVSAATFYQLYEFLQRHRFTELNLVQFAGVLGGGVFLPIISAIHTYYVARDIKQYSKYRKQIKAYNRQLKLK